ncbi:hypothetical protein TB927.1.5180 [Trypanosoma brucei brucei TREU927]|uniref:Uncharacterized protein n=1 Tax=Trypanosoma brucei brucei (strain 927/4 GUTat10.1) TaxID=185431 RepID=Q4GY63_TRYB2|nr:hypothetical protein TB927.1.5180 [Trypanosoma brucei brucei TREU927]CAJ16724.1 hypothetical protein TB927.1.5180 [Trypanosoma brucei brucei TREU927]
MRAGETTSCRIAVEGNSFAFEGVFDQFITCFVDVLKVEELPHIVRVT